MIKVVMVDMCTVCDNKGAPLGHGVKIGNEYYHYLCNEFDIEQYANADILPYLENKRAKALPNQLKFNFTKISRILCILKNLRYIYKKFPNAIIWTYVPDIYIYLFECIFFKGNRKLANIVFEAHSDSKIKQLVLSLLRRKSDIVIITNNQLKRLFPNAVTIPDYTYDRKYTKFLTNRKKERVICLGTMNIKKKIKEAVDVFSKMDYPLVVIGQFASNELYEQVANNKLNNVTVENRYLNNEEYYELLSTSMFCLLPYDPEFYKNRTSGVIQECVFMNTIPITHKSILEFSGTLGIGYENLYELEDALLQSVDIDKFYAQYKCLREDVYNRSKAIICLTKKFKECCN